MNEPLPFRDTGLAVAVQLEEMLLIENDLNGVVAILKHILQIGLQSEDSEQRDVVQSLFRDAVTQFVGCFDSKNAFPLVVEEVFPTAEGIAEYFKWLRGLRNSYTAHRHGSARQCIVGALSGPNGEFLGIGHMFVVYLTPDDGGIKQLGRAALGAIEFVKSKVEALEKQFEAEARAIDPSVLKSLPACAIKIQEAQDVKISRGDLRRKG